MKNLQQEIKAFLKARRWWPQEPADVAKSISIEAAELLEQFQWSHPKASAIKKDARYLEAIGDEIADVLTYALQLAETLGLDSEQIVREKLAKSAKKYPVNSIVQDRKNYWKIKAQHRAKK